jgi:hypothetical protein
LTSCTSARRRPRQIALGLVDLGAHVGERGLGIEAGLEFEQHIAAALERGGAHFLDVADDLSLVSTGRSSRRSESSGLMPRWVSCV